MAIALIVAAGRGERLGYAQPKALIPLAGRPLLAWSVQALAEVRAIEQIVLALPGDDLHAAPAGTLAVAGGATRSESVQRALAAAGPGDPVLVHDAARPLLTPELAQRVLAALEDPSLDAAIAAAPVSDTIKRVDAERVVEATLDRSALWAVQTPQVFRREALERAQAAGPEVLAQATDDAWLIERAGGRVAIVPSPAANLKVTTPLDLRVAELLLAERGASQ
ncbi:MAG TPA: 2-C-methyl-D-erythritol 4-phosphate cytidylyltransferase [Solirubrobacteraceae bacterium]|jgi:2-C-methyl-D-erythritol 4-phosphate cytidylyltransferase|nr:2-C-methyl-D-erythritol 4-phosphate cytidylyltransferase [Solirubrobacteraceae bacterium]